MVKSNQPPEPRAEYSSATFLISWLLFEYESGDQEGGETDEEDPFPGVSGGGGGCEHLSCIVPTYM